MAATCIYIPRYFSGKAENRLPFYCVFRSKIASSFPSPRTGEALFVNFTYNTLHAKLRRINASSQNKISLR